MNTLKSLTLALTLIGLCSCASRSKPSRSMNVTIVFQDSAFPISGTQKEVIREVISTSEREVRELVPKLPDSIEVVVEQVDWNLDGVGGVTGRAESNRPPQVMVQISKQYQAGKPEAIRSGLKATLFHEFHHLSRGWAIQDNAFGPGIPNAMVNEGLAVVFSEMHTGTAYDSNGYGEVTDHWVREILDLPLDASYADWVMGEHPDGRTYIGYRTGNFLIRKAMTRSGKNILDLSELSPEAILRLAGY